MASSYSTAYLELLTATAGPQVRQAFLNLIYDRSFCNITEAEFASSASQLLRPFPMLLQHLPPLLPSTASTVIHNPAQKITSSSNLTLSGQFASSVSYPQSPMMQPPSAILPNTLTFPPPNANLMPLDLDPTPTISSTSSSAKKHTSDSTQVVFEFEKAKIYVTQIGHFFKNNPSGYDKLLTLLHDFKNKILCFEEAAAQISRLFSPQPNYLEGFASFLNGHRRSTLYRVALALKTLSNYSQYLLQSESQKVIDETIDFVVFDQHPNSPLALSAGLSVEHIGPDYVPQFPFSSAETEEGENNSLGTVASSYVGSVGFSPFSEPNDSTRSNTILSNSSSNLSNSNCRSNINSRSNKNNANFLYESQPSTFDIDECERYGKSYIILPLNHQQINASHLDTKQSLLCEEVLNHVMIAVPSGSEGYFKDSVKNQHEELLFRVEDDQYELDMLICRMKSTIRALHHLQVLLDEFEKYGSCSSFKLPDSGHLINAERDQTLPFIETITPDKENQESYIDHLDSTIEHESYELFDYCLRPFHLVAISNAYGYDGDNLSQSNNNSKHNIYQSQSKQPYEAPRSASPSILSKSDLLNHIRSDPRSHLPEVLNHMYLQLNQLLDHRRSFALVWRQVFAEHAIPSKDHQAMQFRQDKKYASVKSMVANIKKSYYLQLLNGTTCDYHIRLRFQHIPTITNYPEQLLTMHLDLNEYLSKVSQYSQFKNRKEDVLSIMQDAVQLICVASEKVLNQYDYECTSSWLQNTLISLIEPSPVTKWPRNDLFTTGQSRVFYGSQGLYIAIHFFHIIHSRLALVRELCATFDSQRVQSRKPKYPHPAELSNTNSTRPRDFQLSSMNEIPLNQSPQASDFSDFTINSQGMPTNVNSFSSHLYPSRSIKDEPTLDSSSTLSEIANIQPTRNSAPTGRRRRRCSRSASTNIDRHAVGVPSNHIGTAKSSTDRRKVRIRAKNHSKSPIVDTLETDVTSRSKAALSSLSSFWVESQTHPSRDSMVSSQPSSNKASINLNNNVALSFSRSNSKRSTSSISDSEFHLPKDCQELTKSSSKMLPFPDGNISTAVHDSNPSGQDLGDLDTEDTIKSDPEDVDLTAGAKRKMILEIAHKQDEMETDADDDQPNEETTNWISHFFSTSDFPQQPPYGNHSSSNSSFSGSSNVENVFQSIANSLAARSEPPSEVRRILENLFSSPHAKYSTFLYLLRLALKGRIGSSDYEYCCLRFFGQSAYPLYSLTRLLINTVFHIRSYLAESQYNVWHEALRDYNESTLLLKIPSTTYAQSIIQQRAIHDQYATRIAKEFSHLKEYYLFSINALGDLDISLILPHQPPNPLPPLQKWKQYIQTYLTSNQPTLDIRKHQIFLMRNVLHQLSPRLQCEEWTSATPSFLMSREMKKRTQHIKTIDGIQVKIDNLNYRMFFVSSSQDFLLHFPRRGSTSIKANVYPYNSEHVTTGSIANQMKNETRLNSESTQYQSGIISSRKNPGLVDRIADSLNHKHQAQHLSDGTYQFNTNSTNINPNLNHVQQYIGSKIGTIGTLIEKDDKREAIQLVNRSKLDIDAESATILAMNKKYVDGKDDRNGTTYVADLREGNRSNSSYKPIWQEQAGNNEMTLKCQVQIDMITDGHIATNLRSSKSHDPEFMTIRAVVDSKPFESERILEDIPMNIEQDLDLDSNSVLNHEDSLLHSDMLESSKPPSTSTLFPDL